MFGFGKGKKTVPPRRPSKPTKSTPRTTTQTQKGNRKPPKGGN